MRCKYLFIRAYVLVAKHHLSHAHFSNYLDQIQVRGPSAHCLRQLPLGSPYCPCSGHEPVNERVITCTPCHACHILEALYEGSVSLLWRPTEPSLLEIIRSLGPSSHRHGSHPGIVSPSLCVPVSSGPGFWRGCTGSKWFTFQLGGCHHLLPSPTPPHLLPRANGCSAWLAGSQTGIWQQLIRAPQHVFRCCQLSPSASS